jgi:hypothetical protein
MKNKYFGGYRGYLLGGIEQIDAAANNFSYRC